LKFVYNLFYGKNTTGYAGVGLFCLQTA